MNQRERAIVQYVAANGPCSNNEIALALGIDRAIIYRFLYRARCYGGGKGWIDNIKPIPPVGDPNYAAANWQTPGQYVVTPAGQAELAKH